MKGKDLKLLVKFPTRSRPYQFFKTIEQYIKLAEGKVEYFVTLDTNDSTMNNLNMIARLQELKVHYHFGTSISKIHAVNRDMHKAPPFDILILASDDMQCIKRGWDNIIKSKMAESFPDTDGCLWFHDGDPRTYKKLNTMVIMSKKYHTRFGYIYPPEYASLWCDNEYTEVALQLGKMAQFDEVLFKHVHFSNTPGVQPDTLMRRTQAFFLQDQKVYEKRKSINFGLAKS